VADESLSGSSVTYVSATATSRGRLNPVVAEGTVDVQPHVGTARRMATDDSQTSSAEPTPLGPVVLSVANVSFRYHADAEWAVRQVALAVRAGERVALTGPSGCGKSTLLLMCAGILGFSDGSIKVNDQELSGLSANERADIRRAGVGLVFQFGELVAELTLRDNIALAAELSGASRKAALEKASALLDSVGLSKVADSKPGAVSGGQAQRCAIARALVHEPRLVLADEPTGALDQKNSRNVLALLADLCRDQGVALLVATHDPNVAAACNRQMAMLDGRLQV